MMPLAALTRFDMLRCTASSEGVLASVWASTTTSMTITMTTSGTRGQVGVD
tara:strand:- start:12917 stop:13069 length:153 start_codon:yes stop_codon:yes gene_type:complete